MPSLLFVDDDEDILDLVTRFFSQHHYVVATAKDGQAMFAQLARQSFDLIVLDVMLPGQDGLSLCRQLRTASDIPVIMLTAMGDQTDRIVGLEVGADDYLGKPFSARELLARVKAVLRRSTLPKPVDEPAETRPVIVFSGWKLDISRRELRTPDQMMVPLSGAEFDLLLVFVEHPQRILTRDQLLDLARGPRHDAFDRSIDVQVSRLRRKIDTDPPGPVADPDRAQRRLYVHCESATDMKCASISRPPWPRDSISRRFAIAVAASATVCILLNLLLDLAIGRPDFWPPEQLSLFDGVPAIVHALDAVAPDQRDALARSAATRAFAVAWQPPSLPAAASETSIILETIPNRLITRLHDGSALIFTPEIRGWSVSQPTQWLLRISIFGVSIVAASVVAASRLARPIAAFAEAARCFGNDPNARPITLQGPQELQQASAAFNAMQSQIQRFVAGQAAMFAAISHDLRTPLTPHAPARRVHRRFRSTDAAVPRRR